MSTRLSGPDLTAAASRVRELVAELLPQLVAISSPSGDAAGFEACAELITSHAIPEAELTRLQSSTDGSPDDLLLTFRGPDATGKRIVLLGHLDTVISHQDHRPMRKDGDTWFGPGTFDMKGGDAIALGVFNELSARAAGISELALLLVSDEEWRKQPFLHSERFKGWDACLCFEGGERTPDGEEAVVVKRKAAASIEVEAFGKSAHAGSKPDDGKNALLALSKLAVLIAEDHAPTGEHGLSAVPTILSAGESLNVVPARGQLTCDLRSHTLEPIFEVCEALPEQIDGVRLEARLGRTWPGMDHRTQAQPILESAAECLGKPIKAAARGGASDASHFAEVVGVAIDGLGPLGSHAHSPDEQIDAGSLTERASVALAIADAVIAGV